MYAIRTPVGHVIAFLGICAALLPGSSYAQEQVLIPKEGHSTSQPASEDTVSEYWLRVTAPLVNVRSRADANSVIMAQVAEDALLRASGSEFGWHRILPPAGAFSYVAAEFVDRRSDTEGIVSVASGTLRVRVGSTVQELDPWKSEVQTLLKRGTRIRIVGQQGEWLKIEPPEEVYAYISDEYVVRISDEVAQRLLKAKPTTSQPASTPATSEKTTTTAPAGPDLSGPWGERLLLVEAAIETEDRKPLLEQAWDPTIERLQPIAQQQVDPMVSQLARAWISLLEGRKVDQAVVRSADDILRQAARERAQYERELERLERVRQRATSGPAFDARGILLRSYVAQTDEGEPLYKLQDAVTQRLVGYVKPGPNLKADPERLLGKYVGLRGERRKDADLGTDVYEATEIVVLKLTGLVPATQPTPQRP